MQRAMMVLVLGSLFIPGVAVAADNDADRPVLTLASGRRSRSTGPRFSPSR